MASITFDTLKFTKTLEASGIPHAQAEAMAEAFRDATSGAGLATQTDLREMELKLEAKINEIKFDLAKWIAGMLLAQAGLVAALVKLL